MAKRWWVLLLVGALGVGGCQSCGEAEREAAEAAARREAEAEEARSAAEEEARAAAAAAEDEVRMAAEREAAAAAAAAAEAARRYTVVTGDSLWRIAEQRWGDGRRWTEIYEANSDSIRDPDLIYPDQVLTIPAG